MQTLLLFSFLIILQTSADQILEQENTPTTFPSHSIEEIEDLSAALFDETLTSEWGVDSNWENNVGLPTASNGLLVDDPESHIIADDERANCIQSTNFPTPSRLMMREQKKIFCIPPQESRKPTSTSPVPSNIKKQGPILPPRDDKKPKIWPNLKQNTEMTNLWIQLNTIPGTNGEKNEEVCKRAEESQLGVARHVPVCFPHPYSLDSPSEVVQPCRLCKEAQERIHLVLFSSPLPPRT